MFLITLSNWQNVSKSGTPTSPKPTLGIICQSYMTQIWCVSVCLSVCLLKLSLLYPAPHMDTAMLRISPSFLTKPSEQPAKNNITCSLRSGPRPPWRRHYRGRGGEELIRFKISPTLASAAATNSKHRPEFLLQAQTAQEHRAQLRGKSLYFWTSSLYIF